MKRGLLFRRKIVNQACGIMGVWEKNFEFLRPSSGDIAKKIIKKGGEISENVPYQWIPHYYPPAANICPLSGRQFPYSFTSHPRSHSLTDSLSPCCPQWKASSAGNAGT